MDKIQQLILDTYNSRPKHFTQILKRNKEVIDYLKEHIDQNLPFIEQLYLATHNESPLCEYGNSKQLKTFNGYTFCGKTGMCRCAREKVSQSVSNTKQKLTEDDNKKINEKRKITVLSKYGVDNVGKTNKAKDNFESFYNDKSKVNDVVSQIKKTKLNRYNDENYNNHKQTEETNLARYGFRNTWSLTDDKQNPNLEIVRDKEKLEKLFPKISVQEIATTYKLHPQTIYYYLNKHELRVPYTSTFEDEIVYFLNELGITNIIRNKRTIIGKELDIFLPDYNLAIEYNGIYWHHDQVPHVTKTYHRDKFILCEEKGIELFTIFSDSWETKKEIWKNKIKSKIGKSKKIYARKTSIKRIDPKDTKELLDNNHIQGYCVSEIAYGLFDNDELVAAMTFSKPRQGIGKKRENAYELVRFVSKKTVVGGASKLLKYFIKEYSPELVYSYSDNQYSVGNLYKILGFSLENNTSIGYRYYDPVNKKMYHRYNFTKYKLVDMGYDKDKTEKEIMDELGYLRIWDCGSKTWIMSIR